MVRFRARLEPVPHGGCYVTVADDVAARAGVGYAARVRGTVDGVAYRSSLMRYGGVFHLGIHKAVRVEAGRSLGDRVEVTLEADPEPLPTDVVPDDLARALAARAGARAAFDALSPAHRREHVKHVIEAKRDDTRARRIDKTVETLAATTRAPRTTRARARARPPSPR
jgi:bacteriocin resistance YdeI/OmpD-like protein/uncharacterized protein DUF1905